MKDSMPSIVRRSKIARYMWLNNLKAVKEEKRSYELKTIYKAKSRRWQNMRDILLMLVNLAMLALIFLWLSQVLNRLLADITQPTRTILQVSAGLVIFVSFLVFLIVYAIREILLRHSKFIRDFDSLG